MDCTSGGDVLNGSWKMQHLLVTQYPPLFHAATNVLACVTAFSQLTNLTHLTILCPASDQVLGTRSSVVDYALISLRIAIERAPLYSLSSLSLHHIQPSRLTHLLPVHGVSSTYSSAERWRQIKSLLWCSIWARDQRGFKGLDNEQYIVGT
jgi:hypothetical protein